ncbi:serine-threonine protein kinase, putative [Entamoeba invadens IP1]|uniref:Serine-threonine protein kinase, putative n=1 Tax=Entamoeba invadens IP1 TaxID=370355 RepID=A0A0A1UF32_ENTIV|nr:serine-threonine protein kinase, putative [Entamoeba invadens IP1]ELP95200.1 serine-threonine protein kinase, putative [Entamoeba invadens IP1]|eukprot:XP_004261971.1 serine-threonine protein kinase, putative [Entamoeba invadens IP1]
MTKVLILSLFIVSIISQPTNTTNSTNQTNSTLTTCPKDYILFEGKCYQTPKELTIPLKVIRIVDIVAVSITVFITLFLLFDYFLRPSPNIPTIFPLEVTLPEYFDDQMKVTLTNTSMSQQEVVVTILPSGSIEPNSFALVPNEKTDVTIKTLEQTPGLLIETVKSGTSIHHSRNYCLPLSSSKRNVVEEIPLTAISGTDKEIIQTVALCAQKLYDFTQHNEPHFFGNVSPKAFDISRGCALNNGYVREEGDDCYLSPEQIFGQDLDERSDVYSFGVVLNEVVNKEKPYGNMNKFEIYEMIKNAQFPRVRENLREDLKIILRNCWKTHDERWDMEQLMLSLQAVDSDMNELDPFFKDTNSSVISLLNEELV